jgi:hypothetical protein
MRSTSLLTAVLITLAPGVVRAQALAIWNGTTGNWTNVALWNTPNYPNNDNPPGTTFGFRI